MVLVKWNWKYNFMIFYLQQQKKQGMTVQKYCIYFPNWLAIYFQKIILSIYGVAGWLVITKLTNLIV